MQSRIICTTLIAFVFIVLTLNAESQRTVTVPPDIENPLNEVIAADTTETGERVDENTVYVLERGGHYLLSGSVSNRGWSLRIVAEEGEGPRPFIQPMVGEGGVTSRAFRIRGDLELEGLHITNMDNAGGIEKNIIRISADDLRIVIDDCFLEYDTQTAFRFDNPGMRFFLTNSVIGNIGDPRDPDNGRGIDFRGNNVDTLFVENSTFYNLTSRVTRDGGGVTRYFHFNHNTIFNIGQHITTIGRAIELNFKNNMVVNGAFLGFNPELEEDWGATRVSTFDTFEGEPIEQIINIRNNNFHVSEVVIEAYPEVIVEAPPFNESTYELIDSLEMTDCIFTESIEFANVDQPVEVVETWYTNPSATPPMPTESEPFDFSYDVNTAAYTASTAGQPLGSLVWFDEVVSVDRDDRQVVQGYQLHQNYPNPFNPATQIQFSIPEAEHVTLQIFNVLGQQVKVLVDEHHTAGTHTVTFDAGTLSSGVYFYRIEAGNFVETKRMMFVK